MGHAYNWFGAFLAAMVLAVSAAAQGNIKPAIVYSTGGKSDKSINESASKGINRVKFALQVQVAEFEPADEGQFESGIRTFAQRGFDPIVVVGFTQAPALEKVSQEFPNTRFTIIDATVTQPNVRSILFKEHESSFLVGMVAALSSKSGKVGFIGGMDSPIIRRFQCGYEQGVKLGNLKATLIADMIGTTPAAWNDPTRAAAVAKAQFDRDVDVVYAAAGTSSLAVLQVAKERGKFAIVGGTKKTLEPGTILTSTLKNVDQASFQALAMAQSGTWRRGRSELGLKEQGVGWELSEDNEKLIAPGTKTKVEAAKADIIAGKIVVADYLVGNACKR